jgi:hypothetical protein
LYSPQSFTHPNILPCKPLKEEVRADWQDVPEHEETVVVADHLDAAIILSTRLTAVWLQEG